MSTSPRNVAGSPVRDGDFYDREQERALAWSRLETDHLLLTAPRRVGKTSLMLKLAGEAHGHGWLGAIVVSAQGPKDEYALLSALCAEVMAAPRCEAAAAKLKSGVLADVFRRVKSLSVATLKVELNEHKAPGGWEVLAGALEEALFALPPGRRLLIMLDELPVFLLRLVKAERERGAKDEASRASAFLEWFRDLRQGVAGRPNPVAWLVAGSIGLGPLARRYGWSGAINDLLPLPLGAFSAEVADRFLQDVGTGVGLTLDVPTRAAILEATGWTIPFYLHLVINELRGGPPPTPEVVDAAVQRLVGLAGGKHFAPWRERLDDELGATDASAARALLDRIAPDPTGVSIDTLRAALSGFYDDHSRDERRRWLLEVLEEDGYLVLDGARWRFRSPLMRAHWAQRLLR